MAGMLAAQQRLQLAGQVVAQPQSVPAPITGWNTRDALDEMPPTDALTLDNWYPDFSGCVVRNGFVQFASLPTTAPVRTLAEYNAGSIRKLLAAAGGAIWDISFGGKSSGFSSGFSTGFGGSLAGGALGTLYSNDAWQTVPFLSRLFFCNGIDDAQVFDGTTISTIDFTGAPSLKFLGCVQYQNRLFFWLPNSTGFYFADLNSISGPLAFFDLSAFSPHGGNLIAAVSFSHDGGDGVTNDIAFIMSSGDCLIYLGNDPSDINFWALIGIYRISPPVGPRAVCQYGAEAFLTTYDDHIPLQEQLVALKLGQLPPRSKVSTAVQDAVRANLQAFGWQALYYPRGRRLIFNIPNPDGTFAQHIQNTALQTQPWCRFIGMEAYCWGLYKDSLYFGAAGGIIYQADTGNLDAGTQAISATAQQAWNMFESPMRKRVAAVRPMLQSSSAQNYTFTLGFDYSDPNITVLAATGAAGAIWDVSPWDTTPWSPENVVDPHWHVGGGTGQSVSANLTANAATGMTWLRCDYRLEPGTAL
jgi:hypothetical protein